MKILYPTFENNELKVEKNIEENFYKVTITGKTEDVQDLTSELIFKKK